MSRPSQSAQDRKQAFHLGGWRDLVEKLQFEIDEFDRTRLVDAEPRWRTFRAVNAALTAWHISDWLWDWVEECRPELIDRFGAVLNSPLAVHESRRKRATAFQKAIANRYRPLAMCRTVATTFKHARSDHYPDPLSTAGVYVLKLVSGTNRPTGEQWHDLRLFADGKVLNADEWLKRSAASWTDFFGRTGLWDVSRGWADEVE